MRGQVCDVLFFGKSLIFLLRGIPKKSIEKKKEKHKIYQNIFHDLLVLETNIYVWQNMLEIKIDIFFLKFLYRPNHVKS